jgi:hypothetical protein
MARRGTERESCIRIIGSRLEKDDDDEVEEEEEKDEQDDDDDDENGKKKVCCLHSPFLSFIFSFFYLPFLECFVLPLFSLPFLLPAFAGSLCLSPFDPPPLSIVHSHSATCPPRFHHSYDHRPTH